MSPCQVYNPPFFTPPVFMRLFQNDTHWIVFDITDDLEQMIVANIGEQSETPHLWRPERQPG